MSLGGIHAEARESEFIFVYSTFPDEASARATAEVLVKARLAACVNLYPRITSVHEWEGGLESATEIAAFIKTRRVLAEQVIAQARLQHPYTTPCFLVLPIDDGNEDYLAWVRAQTSGQTLD